MTRSLFKTLCLATSALCAPASLAATTTPIKHVIIIVGENHTFDNVYGTYQPKAGQRVDNLLSRRIVNADGTPGPNFHHAKQRIGMDGPATSSYLVETPSVGAYTTLPQPYTRGAIGQPNDVPDARFPADLPNGPFQITKYVPYTGLGAYTGDPIHRFFQMWQDWDDGKLDKFVWVETTISTGSNGSAPPVPFNTKEGAIAMGFYNMNPYKDAKGVQQPGDAQVFKSFADNYAISDNYHQAVMGGTGANFMALITGSAAFYTDPAKLDGSVATPPVNQIENPDPQPGTNNWYKQDGYSGGSYVNCSDAKAPGVAPIIEELREGGVTHRRCEKDHYYLVNNYNMYWKETPAKTETLGSTSFVLPPQTQPTIADVLTKNGVSWKYYTGDRAQDITRFGKKYEGLDVPFNFYCGICDPLTGFKQTMTNPSEFAKLKSYGDFIDDVGGGHLPEVAYVRPPEALAGHPADSQLDLYEKFLDRLIARVKASPEWESTAIFITFDEGGGYYDAGYIQQVDFFGDGTRIPFALVSPHAKKGYIDHTYYDHASILKFIERNWKLPKISDHSRDHLPNPVADDDNPYRPANRPAIGDLMNLFAFDHGQGDHDDDDHVYQ